MAFPRISLADPQRGHRAAAEHGGRVDRLAAGHPGKAPPGPGAQVARSLGHHDDVGAEHVPRGQQPGVQRDRLEVTAERLAHGHRPAQPARLAQPGAAAGEPRGQRPAVEHHVHRGRRGRRPARGAQRRQHGRQRRMQVGDHHRHPAEVVRVAQHLVVRRALLVGAEHGGLQRRVARLDQVPGAGRVGGQPVGQRHHQRVAAGAQAERERAGVQQQPVAGLRAGRSAPGRPAPGWCPRWWLRPVRPRHAIRGAPPKPRHCAT